MVGCGLIRMERSKLAPKLVHDRVVLELACQPAQSTPEGDADE
jgi:hypothetical protein